jgi:hypothetical protein
VKDVLTDGVVKFGGANTALKEHHANTAADTVRYGVGGELAGAGRGSRQKTIPQIKGPRKQDSASNIGIMARAASSRAEMGAYRNPRAPLLLIGAAVAQQLARGTMTDQSHPSYLLSESVEKLPNLLGIAVRLRRERQDVANGCSWSKWARSSATPPGETRRLSIATRRFCIS